MMLKPLFTILLSAISLTSFNNVAFASKIAEAHNPLNNNQPVQIAQKQQLINALDLGELLYDFSPISQPQIVSKQHRDALGGASYYEAIEFIVEAKHYVLPLGYFAYFYDANGVEVGITPVVTQPDLNYIQQGGRMYVTIPTQLIADPAPQVSYIVLRKL